MIEYTVQVHNNRTEWLNKDEELHRIDGPAIEWNHGDKSWYINGLRHREDGPACEYINGIKEWYQNGRRHREDGPAYEYPGIKQWFIEGEELTEDEFNQRNSVKEMTVADIEALLGHSVKIVK